MLSKGGGEMKNLHYWSWVEPPERPLQPFLHDTELERPFHCVLESGNPTVIFTKKLFDFFKYTWLISCGLARLIGDFLLEISPEIYGVL